MKKPSIDIIFDTDCLSSFLWIDKEGLIYEIFPESNVYITKEVYDEIFNPKYNLYTLSIDNLFSNSLLTPPNLCLIASS